MAIISANLQFNRGGHGLLDYSSLQTNYSAALAWAQDANSNAAVGQFIYLAEAETIEGVEYAKGPYVVDAIGEGAVLTPLSKSVAGEQDLAGAITDLKGSVGTLTTNLATTDASVNALEAAVAALPESFVTDVKDASGNSVVVDGVVTLGDYATKAELEEAIGNVDFSTLATKEELTNGLAVKADASVVYTKDEADEKYVAKEGYVAFSQDEKNKLAGIAEGAEVNYIKSVGDNLSVDENGKLEVSIPEVEVPFQSVADGDKVLKLENGVLSSTLSYAREDVEGVDSLVLKGLDGEVIGSVPVADFVADGMLESVTPVEGTNKFKFTFKKVDGSTEDFEVDFGKFVDVYHADNETIELNSETNTFSVKANVFDAHGSAAQAFADAKEYVDGSIAAVNIEIGKKLNASTFDAYQTSNDAAVASKVAQSEYDAKVIDIDSSISAIKASIADVYTKTEVNGLVAPLAVKADVDDSLALKANATDVYTKTEIDSSVANAISVAVAPLAIKDAVDASLALKANAADVYTQTEVDDLIAPLAVASVVDGLLAGKVDKVDGKGLSTNDFTNELKTKLEGIEAGAEVNVVKSVVSGEELKLSEAGVLTLDLGAYAKTADVNNGLAAKLDATAKVNGVSFVDGEATIDGEDIALGVAITRTGENDNVENVYDATTSLRSVLASLSQRIDVLDPNVSGELGITSIIAGSGINANVSGGQATISVKASEVAGNMAEVKTDGVYVADMRSYWEAI